MKKLIVIMLMLFVALNITACAKTTQTIEQQKQQTLPAQVNDEPTTSTSSTEDAVDDAEIEQFTVDKLDSDFEEFNDW